MARRLGWLLFFITLVYQLQSTALAAVLDEKGEADAKEATHLFNQGHYGQAAPIYAKLLVDYPAMVIFYRNLGACYYYLNKPEPALSNLRRYLSQRKDLAPDDKKVVESWIDEMEKLRARNRDDKSASGEAEKPAAGAVPAILPTPQPDQPEPTSVALATAAPPLSEVAAKPAGVDLTVGQVTSDPGNASRPFYKTWWFWTGAAVVAGTVTAILIARRAGDPCEGKAHACLEVD